MLESFIPESREALRIPDSGFEDEGLGMRDSTDFGDDGVAEIRRLARADAVNAAELIDRLRFDPREFAERGVVEDYVRRNAAGPRDPQAEGGGALDQLVISARDDRGGTAFVGARLLHAPPLACEREIGKGAAVLQQRHAVGREREDRIRLVGLPQQSFGGELLGVAAHFGDRRVAPEPERAPAPVAPAGHVIPFTPPTDLPP